MIEISYKVCTRTTQDTNQNEKQNTYKQFYVALSDFKWEMGDGNFPEYGIFSTRNIQNPNSFYMAPKICKDQDSDESYLIFVVCATMSNI